MQSFQDRLGQALRANSTFELCAGKKVSCSTKRRYKVHSANADGKLHFSAMMTSPEMSEDKWIIGGQDSCHVCHFLFQLKQKKKKKKFVKFSLTTFDEFLFQIFFSQKIFNLRAIPVVLFGFILEVKVKPKELFWLVL